MNRVKMLMTDENKSTEPYHPEDDTTDQLIDDYKDLPLELVQSSKRKFLTWRDFNDD